MVSMSQTYRQRKCVRQCFLGVDSSYPPYFRRLVKPNKLSPRGSDTKTNCCLKFNPKMAPAPCQVREGCIVSQRVSFVSRTVEHACYTPLHPFCDPSVAFFTLFIELFSFQKGYQCEADSFVFSRPANEWKILFYQLL